MPQKRNPDAAELTRAKVGRIVGAFVALCTILKGLPLTYGKDMQEDKEPVFDAADTLALSVAAATGMMRDVAFDKNRLLAAAGSGHTTATDLADWLVRQANIPFREAHHITGSAVKLAESRGVALDQLSIEDLTAIDARIDDRVYAALSVEASVAARCSHGGTAPDEVRKRVAEARVALGLEESA